MGIKKKNPFLLPKRLNPAALENEYDHKRFEQWVSDLPIGNVSSTAHALHTELNRMNHLEMTPIERFAALELVLPSISFVLEKLRVFFVSLPLPLSKRNRLVARLHLELLVRIVIGYKTILAQFHDDSFTGYLLHKRTRVESSRRLLYFLGELLRHAYSIYKTCPEFVWKEIYGVYHYTVMHELESSEVSLPANGMCGHLVIKDEFKQILLLALANPNSLLKGEVKKVGNMLANWLSEVNVVPITEDGSSIASFIVDAQKDAPPCNIEEYDREKTKIGWMLDTSKLESILEREIGDIRGNGSVQLRPADVVLVQLLTKLKRAWGGGVAPREERRESAGIIDVTCGVGSLYQLFGGALVPEFAADSLNSPFSSSVPSDNSITTVESDEFIIDAGSELSTGFPSDYAVGKEDDVDLEIIESITVNEIDIRGCISVNESSKGCYLTWPGEGEYQVQVGELIGVNPRNSMDLSESWGLGVVRWLRIQSHGLMGFGVELLPGKITPVRLECWRDSGSGADVMLGFQQKISGNGYSLITQPFYIGLKDRFFLMTNTGRFPVVPGGIRECTDSIMQFDIKVASGVEGKAESNNKYSDSDDPFSALWGDLDS